MSLLLAEDEIIDHYNGIIVKDTKKNLHKQKPFFSRRFVKRKKKKIAHQKHRPKQIDDFHYSIENSTL